MNQIPRYSSGKTAGQRDRETSDKIRGKSAGYRWLCGRFSPSLRIDLGGAVGRHDAVAAPVRKKKHHSRGEPNWS